MTTYTKEALNKRNIDGFIGIAMNLQSKLWSCNKEVAEELKALNEKFPMLESDLVITKNANNLFSSLLVEMELQCWGNSQNSRRETF